MSLWRVVNGFLLWLVLLATCGMAMASEYHGQVTFGGLPLPGSQVTVTATQGDKKEVAISDDQGGFTFADLADGTWHLDIEMTGFAPLKEDITVPAVVTAADIPANAAAASAIAAMPGAVTTPTTPAAPTATPAPTPPPATAAVPPAPAAPRVPVVVFEMKLLSLSDIRAAAKPVKVDATAPVVATTPSGQPPTQVADAKGGTPAAPTPAKGAAKAATKGGSNPAAAAPNTPAVPPAQDSTAAQANDGFLINGSVNNAATSQFSLSQAFGNNRNGGHGLYNYSARLILDDSFLDAKSYAVAGVDQAKPSYLNLVGGVTWSGPLKIGHWLPLSKAPNFYLDYQRNQNKQDVTNSVLVPTLTQIGGNLSGLTGVTAIYAPTTGMIPGCTATPGAAFAGNIIPTSCLSSVSQALLKFYPAPNVTGNLLQNYQIPLASSTHTDTYRGQIQKSIGNKNYVNGNFQVSDSRSSSPSIFGFLDTSKTLNTGVGASWYHRFTQRLSMNAGYNFSRSHTQNTPNFANKSGGNVSQNVGISGNLQDPADYGPPGIGFGGSGFTGLSDGRFSNNRVETNAVSYNVQWNKFRHNVTFGGDFRRQEWNYFSQSNPRGSLGFTSSGGATSGGTTTGGSDFADFLLGIPDTSAISYGNADKYLRQSVYDLYADDDFRVSPELSVHGGVRWEYGAPVTELKDRLVNLDIASGFTAETPVLATSPKGALTGQNYPTSLVRPDKIGIAPTLAIAWRPISGSSLLVRAGYGIYHDTSRYQQTALAMAQQAPLSIGQSVPNSTTCRFTIAAPFAALPCATTTSSTFAMDPNFRIGYAQAWQLSVQRDLPFSLQMVATYSGIKGTRGAREFLPNTYAPGLATSPYTGPSGYYYLDSNGNSTREAGTMQLRRRLRNGFQANLTYTYSKSLDDDYSLGGQGPVNSGSNGTPQVAQDWTHPQAQRGLSTFDQRHVLGVQLQYTTGMGLGGHTMLSGWKGAIYKEWTVVTTINTASGLPLTPIDQVVLPGTAYSNIVRASYGPQAGCTPSTTIVFINPCMYGAPASGQFGNARRDSITGPQQFGLNASMNRAFRIHDRYNLTAQLDANNVLNHVTYGSYITTLGTQFGAAPSTANSMRSVQLTFRLRY